MCLAILFETLSIFLVLDLDETLIHFEAPDNGSGVDTMDEDGYYLIRPGCIKFL